MNCLIELHYLPCIEYVACITRFDTLVIERSEHYVKQSYRNRCHINTSQGTEKLIIPVTSGNSKTRITDVRIDYTQKWVDQHHRSVESCYRKAPFYEHYAGEYFHCLSKRYPYLYDLNRELLTICLKWLNMTIAIRETVSYEESCPPDTMDMRNAIHPKKTALPGKSFSPLAYHQVFGNGFVANLSILDLVLCEGPNAMNIVKASSTASLNK